MKTNPNAGMALVDHIKAACQAWSAKRSAQIQRTPAYPGLMLCRVPAPPVDILSESAARRHQWRGLIHHLQLALGVAVVATLLGCVGYVDSGYGGAVVVPGPDFYFFGGGYEHGHEVRGYSDRGFHSREVAHPGGGHGGKR